MSGQDVGGGIGLNSRDPSQLRPWETDLLIDETRSRTRSGSKEVPEWQRRVGRWVFGLLALALVGYAVLSWIQMLGAR